MSTKINEALRLCRVYSDMSAVELKNSIGYSSGFISEIESGKKTPTTQMISKYAEWLGVPVSSLMLFSESICFDYHKTNDVWGDKRYWMTENLKAFLVMIEGNEKVGK